MTSKAALGSSNAVDLTIQPYTQLLLVLQARQYEYTRVST